MLAGLPEYIGTRLCPLLIIRLIVSLCIKKTIFFTGNRKSFKQWRRRRAGKGLAYLSSLALISRENTLDNGVMASFAVFSVKSKAPEIMVVSSWVNSPPFPA